MVRRPDKLRSCTCETPLFCERDIAFYLKSHFHCLATHSKLIYIFQIQSIYCGHLVLFFAIYRRKSPMPKIDVPEKYQLTAEQHS